MTAPLISIILPTYNGSRYLSKSIESCLQQTFHDFELIIVNDCSTDNTLAIANSYASKDSRVKIINNSHNKKLPLSLNAGFERAQGKYFTWTSDDNYYAPEALETMYNALTKDQQIDLVYTDYTLIDENNRVIGVRKFNDINQSFINWLGCGACFLYKKEVHYQNNGYNPSAFLIEDYDFFVRAFLQFRFLYIQNTELYYYREHGASLTTTQSAAINDISKIFLECNLPGLEKKLSKVEVGLLYRKLAVYFAVYKNNITKYKQYLSKLRTVSLQKVLITVIYVFLRKVADTIKVGFSGIIYFIQLLSKK